MGCPQNKTSDIGGVLHNPRFKLRFECSQAVCPQWVSSLYWSRRPHPMFAWLQLQWPGLGSLWAQVAVVITTTRCALRGTARCSAPCSGATLHQAVARLWYLCKNNQRLVWPGMERVAFLLLASRTAAAGCHTSGASPASQPGLTMPWSDRF